MVISGAFFLPSFADSRCMCETRSLVVVAECEHVLAESSADDD